jgi:orotidine-5'-phosphate decarboxylase
MTKQELIQQIKGKQSFLCVGLDTDLTKIPPFLLETEDPVFEFNKRIIDATKSQCVAYKINTAFYECLGIDGWKSMEKTMQYIPSSIFTIADAKRGDIGNTSNYYAKTFFETYHFDSITVAPYMGDDSILPFLSHKEKWAIVLALTSNGGAMDFQLQDLRNGKKLFEVVLEKCQKWGTESNLMFVVGATRAEDIAAVRAQAPKSFFLVPGVGVQGGSLYDVVKYGWNEDCGLLVNASRSIIYAGQSSDFAEKAHAEAKKIQLQMQKLMLEKGFV